MVDDVTTAYRTCPLCEATCGLRLDIADGRVTRVRGDRDDVFSRGFLCPKGSAIGHLHDDPDRLRRPLVRRGGSHVEVSWDEAWAEVAERLHAVVGRHGRESIGVYLGNPGAHSLSAMLYNRALVRGLGTRRRFSASTVDQMPRQVAAGYVFGSPAAVPVPDLDRTDHLVVLGANPFASNGSLCTAPDFPGRLEALRARGGTLVVVDPRRTRTAEAADRWLPIRPGTDALFLAAVLTTLHADGSIDPGRHVGPLVRGLDTVVAAVAPFTPESVAAATGLTPDDIRTVARELAAARTASVYGRIGTTTTEFGTLTSWLIDAVNIATGNLDTVGGAMFTTPVAGGPTTRGGDRRGFRIGRVSTAVRGLPEVMGEFPAATLAEEILDAGEQRMRGLVTVAGNPVLSTPHGGRLADALDALDVMVSVDMYLNETTRHAHVVLPPPSPLQRSHYDVLLLQFAVRNVANYSPPALPIDDDRPDEWEILTRLGLIAAGQGAGADVAAADEVMARSLLGAATADPTSPVHGRDPEELFGLLGDLRGPERLLDIMLQTGPFGAAFGATPDGASLALLRQHPHGVDFGPLEPRLPDALRTPSGMIELDHPILLADVARLRAALPELERRATVLVGRRHLRSNNSWMHNLGVLVRGRERCTLEVHPEDAAALGLIDGGSARVTSRVGSVVVPVEVTAALRPGVVSLPHGWGHGLDGTSLRVAATRPGVNSNLLSDHLSLDPLSGTSVLNGIPVEIVPA